MTTPSAPSLTTGARTPPHVFTLILIAGASVMAMNVFLPVLPLIGRDLGVSDATTQYVLTLYLAATGILQLFIGPLSDRYGRRPVILWAIAIFLLGTLVCIFSTSITWLLIGRLLQASSAACMALSRAIVRDMHGRERAASMIGYITMAMAVMPMISPTLGGYIGEAFGWRATFWILFALGITMLLLTWFDLGETHTPSQSSVSRQVADYKSLLKEPAIWGYISTATLGSGAYFSFLGGAPFVGLDILGLSPSEVGPYFALVALGYMGGNFITGRFAERIGIEPMMLYGSLIGLLGTIIALFLMGLFTPHPLFLFVPMMFVGFGNGMMLPNANAGAVSVRPDLAGSASGLAGSLQIGIGAVLATIAGSLISVENAAMPLYIVMALSTLSGTFSAIWMWRRARAGIAN
ncbi:multidrug effflux MFS transporter [Pseudahrensia aquimaris]|uniref:Bcr/CflA family efflux transporter n=1 Tax=Pseudahrensia aquimaris TaxID=744461 RepID=A0ABW3FHP3_9HYPH